MNEKINKIEVKKRNHLEERQRKCREREMRTEAKRRKKKQCDRTAHPPKHTSVFKHSENTLILNKTYNEWLSTKQNIWFMNE